MNSAAKQPPSATSLTRTTSREGSGSGLIILNKYQLGRLLGRGSFAKVYHGRSLEDNADVAIKAIDKSTVSGPDMEPRVIREVSAMRRLDHHPNILRLHEVMATKTKIYFVMELAPRGELFAKLARRGHFSESMARGYFRQLVSALHFCHKNGVTHRDIKPQNLLLDQKGNLKISDFGLSALPEHLKNGLLHTPCGTPAYTAPEVVYRKGYDGAKADSWSCGVILHFFLVGSLPFDDSNIANMIASIHRRKIEFPDRISRSARKIILRLLDPNPITRLGIEELMDLPWFKRYGQDCQNLSNHGIHEEKDSKHLTRVNAFDIISMSSGLDLTGLFEAGLSRKGMRFTSMGLVEEIEERVAKAGRELGYGVRRGKGGAIGLVKGRAVLVAEILEVAQELWMVEIRAVDGGGGVDDAEWEDLKLGLNDIVVSWQIDGS